MRLDRNLCGAQPTTSGQISHAARITFRSSKGAPLGGALFRIDAGSSTVPLVGTSGGSLPAQQVPLPGTVLHIPQGGSIAP
jgi:hypothetical protein